ncbi:unnamed protein product [Protopolystoma xenopodis]|uniref:Uncharacterized protein n=1 Tax=Protopolystoma xenopodis TaxID=117903 RepID=A0A3S5CEH8_9PLAT|nr:unnamed protein product [Protopolystoma xenopodis]
MIPCSDDVRHMKHENLAPFHRNRKRLPRKQRQHECSSKSRGIRRRLLVEPTFESLHQTLSLEMEIGPRMEGNFLQEAMLTPKLWARYMNDYIVIWPNGKDGLDSFLLSLKQRERSIEFTMEME